MLPQTTYTKIYTNYDNYGHLQLLLYNEISNETLFFDGFDFSYKPSSMAPLSGFKEIKGNSTFPNAVYEIKAIRQSDDITFIKFSNGNLFQIHTMPYGYNELKQVLSVYEKERHSLISTPSGINSYEAALVRMDKAEVCEIAVE